MNTPKYKKLVNHLALTTAMILQFNLIANAMDKGVINAYLSNVRTQMDNAWTPGEGKTDVILTVTVDNAGKILNTEFTDNGSSKIGIEAVKQAFSKVKFPLMACDKNATIVVTYTFKSTYDKHGDSNATLSCKLYIKQKYTTK